MFLWIGDGTWMTEEQGEHLRDPYNRGRYQTWVVDQVDREETNVTMATPGYTGYHQF